MIAVSKESWHARLYLWWYWNKYRDRDKEVCNLCPYVRTVLVWAPCRWLFLQGRVHDFRVAWVVWPILLFSIPQPLGYLSYHLKMAAWIVVGLLAFASIGATVAHGFFLLVVWSDKRWHWGTRGRAWVRQSRDLYFRKHYHEHPPKKKKGASFRELIGKRIRAGHDRICPEIVFEELTNNSEK